MGSTHQDRPFQPGERVRFTGRHKRVGIDEEGEGVRVRNGMVGDVIRGPEPTPPPATASVRYLVRFETGEEWVRADHLERE
jgi:hypothetical protein